ncbi:MAG TPA: pepsin/retropepsin-like aspartic protease family protein [Thermoanaerobaculia bacterium]|nr:pepsin/retropepsin-like aspartic protease family protein [Thermoanaerobaculia bacterium]
MILERVTLRPDMIQRPTLQSAVKGGDCISALDLAALIDKPDDREKLLLAQAQLRCGRFAEAGRNAKEVLEGTSIREQKVSSLWILSQAAYMANDFNLAHQYAAEARRSGLQVLGWHLTLLESLAATELYRIDGDRDTTVEMTSRNPGIPRIPVRMEGQPAIAVIDSGAAHTIVSESLAGTVGLVPIENARGVFYGLLGEPIAVSLSRIDSLEIGSMTVRNVPVAIMSDEKLSFFTRNQQRIRLDLLLGAMLLKEFRIRLDSASDRASFTALSETDRRPAPDQNLFFLEFRPYVRAVVNGYGWYPFLLDTGSEITWLNRSRLRIDTPLFSSGGAHRARLQGLGGAQVWGEKLSNVSIGIGGWAGRFRHLPLYSGSESEGVGIIGQNLLSHFIVEIDFGRMRVELLRR